MSLDEGIDEVCFNQELVIGKTQVKLLDQFEQMDWESITQKVSESTEN